MTSDARLVLSVPTPPAVPDPAHVREGDTLDQLTALFAAHDLEVIEAPMDLAVLARPRAGVPMTVRFRREPSDTPAGWHVITCEYPPQIGGVSDFVSGLARSLAAASGTVHVWAPFAEGTTPAVDDVVVHRTLGSFAPVDCLRTGRLLDAAGRPRLFVQWVPHGYGYKSLNVPFAAWLAWRARVRGNALHLMVHEPYMRASWPPLHVLAATVQKLMLWLLGHAASHVWLSTEGWRPWVTPFVRQGTPVSLMPVSSPIEPEGTDAVTGDRPAHTPLVVGHFSTCSPVVTVLLAPVLLALLDSSDVHIRLIGRDSQQFAATFLAQHPAFGHRVHAVGTTPLSALPAELVACDLMLQPYPDGITARNTSALAALAFGLPVVSNSGPLTEPFWSDAGAAILASAPHTVLLAEQALAAVRDPALRRRVARTGAAMYATRLSRAHAVSRLSAHVET